MLNACWTGKGGGGSNLFCDGKISKRWVFGTSTLANTNEQCIIIECVLDEKEESNQAIWLW